MRKVEDGPQSTLYGPSRGRMNIQPCDCYQYFALQACVAIGRIPLGGKI